MIGRSRRTWRTRRSRRCGCAGSGCSAWSGRGAYAQRIAVNLARRHLKRLARERSALERAAGEPGPAAPDQAEALSLREVVAALPPRQRAVIVCRFYADLSVADTAAAMGCREGTVKALTHQAVAALRRSGVAGGEETT